MYWVYVLKAENYKKSYVGYTDDLPRRLDEHNRGQSSYTSKFRPWKIIYGEEFVTKKEAISRERFLKSQGGRRFLKNVVFN